MCGICSATGINFGGYMPAVPTPGRYIGDRNDSGGLVPQITKPSQITVQGTPTTGRRITVVDTMNPSSWPHWISAQNGKPVDNGMPGGTYIPQNLPDLVVTARPWGWLIALVIGIGLVMVSRK